MVEGHPRSRHQALKVHGKLMARDIRLRSAQGSEFDCYLAVPEGTHPVPAVVLASAIHGVDADLRGIADDFASRGFMAAAPDLFWRTTPGPLPRGDPRAPARAQPRLQMIAAGEQDLIDVLQALKGESRFDGRAMVAGFCYGGPYAVIGPKRLGYQAGVSLHGTQMADYVAELEGLRDPVCLVWGDDDHLAPPAVRDAYIAIAARNKNVAVHVFPRVKHGFMMRGNAEAFDSEAYDFSVECADTLLQ
jgi:carboxymethylenebutenolidase